MKFSEFYEEIAALDKAIAAGSETWIFGDFVERYDKLVQRLGLGFQPGFSYQMTVDSVDVPDAERRWWISAYRLLADQEADLRAGRLSPEDALAADALFSSVD